MFTNGKLIESTSLRLLTVCILLLCLAVPTSATAASSEDLAVRADHLPLASKGFAADPPEIFIPKPPPPPGLASKDLAADPPEILIPKPPPPPVRA